MIIGEQIKNFIFVEDKIICINDKVVFDLYENKNLLVFDNFIQTDKFWSKRNLIFATDLHGYSEAYDLINGNIKLSFIPKCCHKNLIVGNKTNPKITGGYKLNGEAVWELDYRTILLYNYESNFYHVDRRIDTEKRLILRNINNGKLLSERYYGADYFIIMGISGYDLLVMNDNRFQIDVLNSSDLAILNRSIVIDRSSLPYEYVSYASLKIDQKNHQVVHPYFNIDIGTGELTIPKYISDLEKIHPTWNKRNYQFGFNDNYIAFELRIDEGKDSTIRLVIVEREKQKVVYDHKLNPGKSETFINKILFKEDILYCLDYSWKLHRIEL